MLKKVLTLDLKLTLQLYIGLINIFYPLNVSWMFNPGRVGLFAQLKVYNYGLAKWLYLKRGKMIPVGQE